MKNIFFRREGQIAPFLIAVIVVLIIALMVTVNIGKVGITKTNTANASDAGALAGSTTHANTLNALADTNTAMIAEYLATQILFSLPITVCFELSRFIAHLAFMALQLTQYILAWQNGTKGYEAAESAAKQFAFSNAGIDEPKPRLDGEAYETYLRRDSRFGQWMQSEGYDSGQYTWTDKNGQQNSVTVDVEAPSFPGLLPMPGVLLGIYLDIIPICIPCTDCCMVCQAALATYWGCLLKVGIIAEMEILPNLFPCSCPPCCCPCWSVQGVTSPGGLVHFMDFAFPSQAFCGGWAWNFILYPVPIAFIANIIEDNPQITVTTTRVEPNIDLGLREMKYGTISSSAKAETTGGSVGPVPNPGYDSYLISGGY